MVILDKNLKFVKWFNSKKESPKLKQGEFVEKDEAVPFVFFQGENIITNPGHYTETAIQQFLDLGYGMMDRFSLEWYGSELKNELKIKNGKVVKIGKEIKNEKE